MKANIAVVGCGRWGQNHVKTLLNLGALGCVVEPDPAGRKTASDILGNTNIPVLYSVEEVLANPDYNGITVATPVNTHFDMARKALAANKYALIEKPLCLKEGEGLELRNGDPDKRLMVGHLLLHSEAFAALSRKVKDLESNGLKVTEMHCVRKGTGTERPVEGVFASLAPHDLSIVFSLFPEHNLTHLQALSQLEHTVMAKLKLLSSDCRDRLTCTVYASWKCRTQERTTTLIFNDGTSLMWDQVANILHEFKFKTTDGRVSVSDESFVTVVERIPLLTSQMASFIRLIETGDVPKYGSVEEGRKIACVIDGVSVSLAHNKEVKNKRNMDYLWGSWPKGWV
ncbi:MAG: Gfo/Idh/MocA family oxidoreductase [Candidatus Riesia sp.]|nr:Gfo/Idh/MocA family oxidoreductase [Candidatus Riesia sp.]